MKQFISNVINLSKIFNIGVVALDGLLYVIGGIIGVTCSSVEFYNLISNTWTLLEASINVPEYCVGAVAIARPPNFI